MHRENLNYFSGNHSSVFVRQEGNFCSFNKSESWVILSDIEQHIKEKIERIGTPLKDWDIQINYGIKTGFNEAFIINGTKRKELIEQDPKSAEIIRPILRGRDIKRYVYEFADLYLLFIPWHFPLQNDTTIQGVSKKAEQAFQEQYPAVYKHLLSHKVKLENRNRAETGMRYEWYALQRWGANYWEDFSKQKIIYPEITKFLNFHLDDEVFYVNNKCFILSGHNLYFLVAFLNSSLFKFCFRDNFPELLGGSRELRKVFLEQIPVIKVSESTNSKFECLLRKIQLAKQNKVNTIDIEKEIDEAIFDLYSLSFEEKTTIGFIEIQ